MTQSTPDLCHIGFAPRMPFVFVRSANYFLLVVLLLMTGSYASVAAPKQSSDNPNAKPVPTAQQAPAASNDATNLQKAVHQKKVITEDDLSKPAKPISLKDLEGEENNPVCDLSCEAQLREEMGYGPDREAEFRNQLTLARHEIAVDKVWNSYLDSALQAASGYCEIQRQKAQILGKGVVAPYTRDSVNSRFAEREHNFVLQHRNAEGYLTQRMQAVQRYAPFRAAVMQYYLSEATTRVCPDYPLPSQ
jgi:hypothetical protein